MIILQHPSDNAIIVLAPDETEIQHVRGLVKILDVQTTVEWVKVSVEHGDAGSINETVVEILNAPSSGAQDRGAEVPSIHRSGGRRTLVQRNGEGSPAGQGACCQARRLQRADHAARVPVDLPATDVCGQHASGVRRQRGRTACGGRLRLRAVPTPKASTRAAGLPCTSAVREPRRRPRSSPPDDPNKQLWVLCTETEWTEYTALMQKLDQPPDRGEPFVRIAVENADPETVVERLSKMVAAGPSGLDSSIRLIPTDNAILVIGASSQEIERLKLFLPEADKPASVEQRIFEIRTPTRRKSSPRSRCFSVGRRKPRVGRRGPDLLPVPAGGWRWGAGGGHGDLGIHRHARHDHLSDGKPIDRPCALPLVWRTWRN